MVPGQFVEGEFDDMPPQFAKTREETPDYRMYREEGGRGCTVSLSPAHRGADQAQHRLLLSA